DQQAVGLTVDLQQARSVELPIGPTKPAASAVDFAEGLVVALGCGSVHGAFLSQEGRPRGGSVGSTRRPLDVKYRSFSSSLRCSHPSAESSGSLALCPLCGGGLREPLPSCQRSAFNQHYSCTSNVLTINTDCADFSELYEKLSIDPGKSGR